MTEGKPSGTFRVLKSNKKGGLELWRKQLKSTVRREIINHFKIVLPTAQVWVAPADRLASARGGTTSSGEYACPLRQAATQQGLSLWLSID